eukprot:CAMPEP_0170923066 /NCGR_PEP_ID=MMETSP0735-20130129/10816_1 /TAXON_ID=186038 /ORGANISM="Fragilariopsis kerguelensis, Strain L26-C5" /LENGTH=103 /DNA_ID=CAMNT_0011322583 /DNA_START=107 /DNA_END=418 /DNA_ORIENTATION=-
MVFIPVIFLGAFGGSFVGSVVGVVGALVGLGESVGDEKQEEQQEVGDKSSIDGSLRLSSCGETESTLSESMSIVDSWCYQDPEQGMMMKYRISDSRSVSPKVD